MCSLFELRDVGLSLGLVGWGLIEGKADYAIGCWFMVSEMDCAGIRCRASESKRGRRKTGWRMEDGGVAQRLGSWNGWQLFFLLRTE